MFCASATPAAPSFTFSGSVPEDPVASKDGYIFERRLIEKHVQETGRHPLTSEDLSVDDLVPLKTNKAVKPRPSPATSIPGLLGLFHNEWDATMLETHQLRQALNTSRQELAHALYQHDAAARVIARLLRERDEARKALETAAAAAPAEMANGKRGAAEEEEDGAAVAEGPAKRAKADGPAGLSAALLERMDERSRALSKTRKKRQMRNKRQVSASLAPSEAVAELSLLASQPLHKTSKPGILAIDASPAGDAVVATAGADGDVHLFDRAAELVLATLQGHSKKVNDVKFLADQSQLVTAGADKTVRIWTAAEGGPEYVAAAVLKDHTGEVTAATVHPLRDHFVTASLDMTWAMYDANAATCLVRVEDAAVEAGYRCAAFHPDGVILGTGTTDGLVLVWEVKQQKNVAKFEGHKGAITAVSFSENGYYLATGAADGVKLWDLRKLKNFKTLTPYDGTGASAVTFDHSGLYMAVGGADARVYGVKQDWEVVKTFPDMPKKGVCSLMWGEDAKTLFVGAADHNLRIYGVTS